MKKLLIISSLFISSIALARPMGYYNKVIELGANTATTENIRLSKGEFSKITASVKGEPRDILTCQLIDLENNVVDENKLPTDFCNLSSVPIYDRYYTVKIYNTSKDEKVVVNFEVH